MSTPTVDEFRAKVIVICADAMNEPLTYGFVIRRVAEEYAKAIAEQAAEIDELGRLIARIAQDWQHVCGSEGCACTMAQAVRFARQQGVDL